MKPKSSDKREVWLVKSAEQRAASDSTSRITNDPIPMKDKKPVTKHPNAADNFWNTHQAEYDERGQPSNRCGYVNSHNDACPKMKDELDRRRDASKPIACQTRICPSPGVRCATQTLVSEQDWSDPHCIMCSERRKQARHVLYINNKRERRSRDSRVSKSRRKPRRVIKITKALSAKDDQYLDNAKPKNSKSDLGSIRYPDTSPEPSLTSYNSNMSMDHEPMITK